MVHILLLKWRAGRAVDRWRREESQQRKYVCDKNVYEAG